MTLRDRIGYDAGVTRLEDALQAAAAHQQRTGPTWPGN